MIDLAKEKPVPLSKVAAFCGVHRRTVESWFDRGLDSIRLGGRLFTSFEALQRFARPGRDPTPSAPRRPRFPVSNEEADRQELMRLLGQ